MLHHTTFDSKLSSSVCMTDFLSGGLDATAKPPSLTLQLEKYLATAELCSTHR